MSAVLFSPDGRAVTSQRQEIKWPRDFMRMLAIFAANAQDIDLGIRCERCKEVLQGTNARADNYWKMECACRTYVGLNPLSTAARRLH